MATKRTADELLDEPDITEEDTPTESRTAELPFNTAIDLLSIPRGEPLEMLCRATPQIGEAVRACYNMCFNFGSRYLGGVANQLMRLSVSQGGEGRKEIVQSLDAGGSVTDGFYGGKDGAGYEG